jgi:hypothetical protein
MANHIFARIELHERPDGTKPDYKVLRENMALQKFSHELLDGFRFLSLPTGEYVTTALMSLDNALLLVKRAADQTGFENCGVITSAEGHRHFGLKARPIPGLFKPQPTSVKGPAPKVSPGVLGEILKKRLHP